MHDRFGVGRSVEKMSGRLELVPELPVVVDFAVEHDPDGAILVMNRLMSGREVNDTQPPHAEPDALLDMHAFVVRSAMPNHLAHAMHQRSIALTVRFG